MKADLENLIVQNDKEKICLLQKDRCDKYDYLAAAGCGVDIFLVGMPKDSKLVRWSDAQVDSAVKNFAKLSGWTPSENQKDNVASAIGFLEKKFKINYDQRHTVDVGGQFHINTKNHHLLSLSHSPDILGLFFSVLNQFTDTSSFIAEGQLITISTESHELMGKNIVAKIFCGISNWFGHIMSDVAGSSGSRGGQGRGMGIAIPFYELFGFCKFGKFSVEKAKQDVAVLAERGFKEGYDFRFGLATAIPVMVTELSIKLIWSLRRFFSKKKKIGECIPNASHSDLRVMLLIGYGSLCALDGIDAVIKSGGNMLILFARCNIIAWFRFLSLVFKEICIRLGIAQPMQQELAMFQRIREATAWYLAELEKIDIKAYCEEIKTWKVCQERIMESDSEEGLNRELRAIYQEMDMELPWGDGSFEPSKKIVFKA